MSEKAILITGCSSGIGRCMALGLKRRGYRVFATVRSERDMPALEAAGLETLSLDLASSDSIRLAVDECLRRTGGKLFALINNGAYGQPGAVEDVSRATLRAQFETNLFGTHELTTLIMPVFRSQGSGRIIQISSILGFVSLAYRGAYTASKYALEGLSDTLRLELAGTDIKVALIEPGPIESRFRQNAYAAFIANIDRRRSPHRAYYRLVEARLSGNKNQPFTLPPEAVLAKVIHALESRNPNPRYFVTFPTGFLALMKRVLPVAWLDRLLAAVTAEKRGNAKDTPPGG